jgi:hypothetical protein
MEQPLLWDQAGNLSEAPAFFPVSKMKIDDDLLFRDSVYQLARSFLKILSTVPYLLYREQQGPSSLRKERCSFPFPLFQHLY